MKVGRLDQKSCYLSVVAQASPATLPAAKNIDIAWQPKIKNLLNKFQWHKTP